MPAAPPTNKPIRGAIRPTVSEVRAPNTSREATSRPKPSVPSQCRADGPARVASMSMSVGLGRPNQGASSAAPSTATIHATAHQNAAPRRRPRAGAGTALSSAAATTDARVEHGVDQVDG